MSKIIHHLDDTGTPNGQSGIRQLANRCPRRWFLQKKYGDSPVLGDKNLSIGKFLHAYMELYYRRAKQGLPVDFDIEDVEFDNIGPGSMQEEWCATAARLFKNYRQRYKLETAGRIEAVERLLPEGEITENREFIPSDPEAARRVGKAVNFTNYTARVDLVTEITEDMVRPVRLARQIGGLTEPGYYAWDWKTTAFLTKTTLESHRDSLQFTYYQTAWNETYPDKPLKGMIIVVITKTKMPDFRHLLVKPPNEAAITRMHACSEHAKEVLARGEPFYANTDCCYDWNKDCEWRQTGLCERI